MDYQEYLEPRFTLKQASEAAAFPLNTLRSNYQRGWFESFGKGLSSGRGRAQKLCLGDVLVLAIASRLIDIGFGPQRAFNTARVFGIVANTPKGMPRRKPFELFDRKRFDTVLHLGLNAPPRAAAVPKGGTVSLEELRLDREFGDATVMLLLNPVEETVLHHLGLQPLEPSSD